MHHGVYRSEISIFKVLAVYIDVKEPGLPLAQFSELPNCAEYSHVPVKWKYLYC